jgi:hypothetical protein
MDLLARSLVARNGCGKEVPIQEKKPGCSTWQNLLPLIDELFNVFFSDTCNGLYSWRSFIYLTFFNLNVLQFLYKKVLLEDTMCEYWKQIGKCHSVYVDFRNYVVITTVFV